MSARSGCGIAAAPAASPHLIDGPTRLTPSLVGVIADTMPFPSAVGAAALHDPQIAAARQAGIVGYFPEQYLARWFREQRGEEVTIWCFDP